MIEHDNYTEDVQGSDEPLREPDATPHEIEREIQQTRGRMSRDIDELGQRLSPQNLKEEAKEAIAEKAQEVAGKLRVQARYTGSRVVDFIQENPSLVAAMGLGAVWLVQQRNRSGVSGDRMARFAYTGPERRGRGTHRRFGDRGEVGDTVRSGSSTAQRIGELTEQAEGVVDRTRERMDEMGEQVRERGRQLGDRAREQTQRARGKLERAMDENPLALMAGVAVLGLAVGLLVPETKRERRLMGPTRDQLREKVQHTAGRVKDAAIEAGHEVQQTVNEEIAARGPELKGTVKDAARSVVEQVKESAERVKNEAKQAATENPEGRGPENR